MMRFSIENDNCNICFEVDANGTMVTWDYCDGSCPGVDPQKTPQLNPNPLNEPGEKCCTYLKFQL